MKTLNKVISVLIIMILLTADFSVLGTGLKSYAASNTDNIKYDVYFVNEKGEKVTKIDQATTNKEAKLHIKVSVENQGYFNGGIELENSNFKFKTGVSLSKEISSIEENKIGLKQINAGESIDIDVVVQILTPDTITAEELTKKSTISLVGTYMKENSKATEVKIEKNVQINLVTEENAEVELVSSIITNKVMEVNGENKRVIQVLVNSRVAKNQYPVRKEEIRITAPSLKISEEDKYVYPEKVEGIALSTKATNNGNAKVLDNITNNDGIVEVEIANEENENKEVQWSKTGYDQIVVTLIYEEKVEVQEEAVTATSEITLYNDTKIEGNSEQVLKEEVNNVLVIQENSSVSQIYKGQLYANTVSNNKKEIEYKDQTTVFVTNANIVNQIKVTEKAEKFLRGEEEISASSRYVSTKINKAKMIDILGEEGKIAISYGDKSVTISKDSEVDENGDIVVEYKDNVNTIEIITTNPEKAGVLEIVHTKALTENEYTKEELKNITGMKNEIQIQGVQSGKVILEGTKNRTIELLDTITKAELKMEKTYLSTMNENNVVMDIKLVTDGEQYDLYKNPEIKVKLPEAVEDVTINNADKLYAEGFEIKAEYDKEARTIVLKLTGEQTDYTVAAATQIFLQLDLTIKLNKLATKGTAKVEMEYTNENATNYYGETTEAGKIEKQVNIVTQTGLIATGEAYLLKKEAMLSSATVNEEAQTSQSLQITQEYAGSVAVLKYIFTNNSDESYKNVKIRGILPTTGNTIDETENTLETTLLGVEAEGTTIYYTENANASEDLTDSENGWTTDITTLKNAKLFLVVMSDEFEVGKTLEIKCSTQIPEKLEDGQMSITRAQMIYDTDTKQNQVKNTNDIKLQTVINKKINVGGIASVNGEDKPENSTIKVGEILKYRIGVYSDTELTNVILKGSVPAGTVYIDENGNEDESVKEVTKEMSKMSGTETIEYNVRVKENVGTLINTITVTGDGVDEKAEYRLKTESARLQVELVEKENNYYAQGARVGYALKIKNLENVELQNIKINLNIENAEIAEVWLDEKKLEKIDNAYVIEKLEANVEKEIFIYVNINEEALETKISAKLEDGEKDYNTVTIKNTIYSYEVKIEASSQNKDQELQLGAEKNNIEYNFTIENIGDLPVSVDYEDVVSTYLNVLEVYVNGELQEGTSRKIKGIIGLDRNEKATIKVVTENIDLYSYKFKKLEILNNFTVSYEGKKDSTQVKHIIKGMEGLNYEPEKDNGEEKPDNPDKPNTPDNPNNPDNPSTPDNPDTSTEETTKEISGIAWLDVNQNGEKDEGDTVLSGIKVKAYDISTKEYAKDTNGKVIETTTDENGKYELKNLKKGKYIVLFEYDADMYELTTYNKPGVEEANKSNVVLNNIEVNGQEMLYAVTDTIDVQNDISNINIGLKLKMKFDLELNKYISRVTVQTSKKTKTYNYDKSTFGRLEIHSKELNGATVIFEYTIEVKNTGDIAGYANNIVDYLPEGLTFNSELNQDWYMLDGNLYTKKLESTEIKPGETQEIKLILTKTMTNNNVGLINNRAEIYESYNKYGIPDVDSVANNQINTEDDIGSADVFVGISTGGTIALYVIIGMVNIVLLAMLMYIYQKKNKTEKKIF